MRASTSVLVAAFLSAVLLAACGGSGPSSSTPMSDIPRIAAPLSQWHERAKTPPDEDSAPDIVLDAHSKGPLVSADSYGSRTHCQHHR